MLATKAPLATVAVRDLAAARPFYEETLGLGPAETSQPGTALYRCGGADLLVYQSGFAGSCRATAVTWRVGDDIGTVAADLAGKGVRFEHYEVPHTAMEGDIHVFEGLRVAWFKDPDGNIHALVSD